MVGPEAEKRGCVVAAATDRDQSSLLYEEISALISDNKYFEAECIIRKHEKTIEVLSNGTKFRALSSDAKKAHGLNASVVILDELSQWGEGAGRNLYDALTTASGARKEPLVIAISTQSANPHNVMSELIDYAKAVRSGGVVDPTFSGFVYEVPENLDVFDPANWILANPGIDIIRSREDMAMLAARARRMPSLESSFRNLFCNQRVNADERWLPAAEWLACGRTDAITDEDLLGAGECFGGLDLSSINDTTAFALFWPRAGFLKVWAWLPEADLRARVERDRVPYGVWRDRGFLELTPGRTIDKKRVTLRLAELCAKYQPRKIGFDPWGIAEIERVCSENGIRLPLEKFSQAMSSMGPAVRAFEERVLSRTLLHDNNPILTWHISNAAVQSDPAGNRKLDKASSRSRVDLAIASVIAAGVAAQAPPRREFDFSAEMVIFGS